MENDCEPIEVLHRHSTQQLEQKNYQAAAIAFAQVIHLQPDHASAWYGQGDALANLHRYPEALESFDRAIALNPLNPAAWTFRGVVLLHLERYPEALESCDRALKICPEDQEAWTFRGVALQRLGRYGQAYKSFQAATPDLDPPISWRQKLGQVFRKFLNLLRRFQKAVGSS